MKPVIRVSRNPVTPEPPENLVPGSLEFSAETLSLQFLPQYPLLWTAVHEQSCIPSRRFACSQGEQQAVRGCEVAVARAPGFINHDSRSIGEHVESSRFKFPPVVSRAGYPANDHNLGLLARDVDVIAVLHAPAAVSKILERQNVWMLPCQVDQVPQLRLPESDTVIRIRPDGQVRNSGSGCFKRENVSRSFAQDRIAEQLFCRLERIPH